jgi:hypothetical protein
MAHQGLAFDRQHQLVASHPLRLAGRQYHASDALPSGPASQLDQFCQNRNRNRSWGTGADGQAHRT